MQDKRLIQARVSSDTANAVLRLRDILRKVSVSTQVLLQLAQACATTLSCRASPLRPQRQQTPDGLIDISLSGYLELSSFPTLHCLLASWNAILCRIEMASPCSFLFEPHVSVSSIL